MIEHIWTYWVKMCEITQAMLIYVYLRLSKIAILCFSLHTLLPVSQWTSGNRCIGVGILICGWLTADSPFRHLLEFILTSEQHESGLYGQVMWWLQPSRLLWTGGAAASHIERKKLDSIIRKCSSVLGFPLDSVRGLGSRTVQAKTTSLHRLYTYYFLL